MLDLWSRTVATSYEFKIIIDIPKALTWIISESAQGVRWILGRGLESRSITNCILVPTSQMSPIQVCWALKEDFQSKGTLGPRRKISSLTLAIHPIEDKDSQSAQNKGEQSEQHLCEFVKCWTKSSALGYCNYHLPSPNLNVAWLSFELKFRWNCIPSLLYSQREEGRRTTCVKAIVLVHVTVP